LWVNGSMSSSGEPGQPTQAPRWVRITGSKAVTSPPGEVRHSTEPSGFSTRSTGSRLATTTKEARFVVRRLAALIVVPPRTALFSYHASS
jgi:hypothetical protein